MTVEKGRVEYWGPYAAGAGVAVAFVLFLLAGLYTFRQQEHVNHQLCQQTVDNREAIRSTWDAARMLIIAGEADPERQKRTNDFFDGVLKTIPPLKCVNNKPIEA
jgi:hypothetical protein